MYLNCLNVLSTVTVLIAVVCDARVLDRGEPGSVAVPGWHIDTPITIKRQSGQTCKPACTPASCGGRSCTSSLAKKRALSSLEAFSNVTDWHELEGGHIIEKRRLTNPQQRNIGTYLDRQSETAGLQNLCPDSGTGGFDMGSPTFCIQQTFASLSLNANGQWLAGTGDTLLTGCTVLVVVSARAVYICHIWQDLHYESPEGGWRTMYGFQPVVNMITGSGPTPGAVGPAIDVSLFDTASDNTFAFIMTPRSGAAVDDPAQRHYQAQYNTLYTLLTGLIPGIGIISYNYDFRTPYDEAYQGIALFEYDNDSDGRGTADWRLWFEAANERGTKLGQPVT